MVIQELLLNHGYTKSELASLLDINTHELDLILLETRSSLILTRSSSYLIEKHAKKSGIKITAS